MNNQCVECNQVFKEGVGVSLHEQSVAREVGKARLEEAEWWEPHAIHNERWSGDPPVLVHDTECKLCARVAALRAVPLQRSGGMTQRCIFCGQKVPDRKCVCCKRVINQLHGRSKYCKKCADLAQKAYKRRWWKENMAGGKP